MPTSFDNTYHYQYSAPAFTCDADQDRVETQRINEYLFEEDIPALPSREQEVEYMIWLEDSIREDPIISKRQYRAGPQRTPYKRYAEMRTRYQLTWYTNFVLSIFLSWPVAVGVGRWWRRGTTGVPRVKVGRHNQMFFNLHPQFRSNRQFWIGFLAFSIPFSWLNASIWTPTDYRRNEWYTRPDLKPKKVMVEETAEEKAMLKHIRQTSTLAGIAEKNREQRKKSGIYRYLMPYSADYNLRVNPIKDLPKTYRPGRYDDGSNFADHHYDM